MHAGSLEALRVARPEAVGLEQLINELILQGQPEKEYDQEQDSDWD